MTRTRVLILQPYLAPYRMGLFNALSRRGDLDLLLVYFNRYEKRRQWTIDKKPAFRERRVRSLIWPRSYEYNYILTNVFHLAWILFSERPQVVVCAANTEGKVVRLLKPLLRCRLVLWSEATLLTSEGRTPSKLMKRWFYPALDAFLVPGREAERYLVEGAEMDPRRAHRMPNSVDMGLFQASEEAIRRKFATPRPLRLAFVGSLTERKGYHHLLQALRRLAAHTDLPPFEAHVAGTGPLEGQTAPAVRARGFLNEEQCAELLKASHLFVLPSLIDCNPLTLVEAAAAGCVVVVTEATCSHPEFVQGNGVVVATDSAPALEDALRGLLQTAPEQLCQMALRSAALARGASHEACAQAFAQALTA